MKLDSAQVQERELLVFSRGYDPDNYRMGGIRYFDSMSVGTAKKLLDKGYIDPDDTQNCSPTMRDMIDFCDDGTDKWYLHGYVVSPERDDCRITFEGVGSVSDLTQEEAFRFLRDFRFADELECDAGCHAYCWFD